MIKLSDKYYLLCDKNQYIIATKYKAPKGEIVYSHLWFYTKFEHLVEKLVEMGIKKGIKKGSWEAVSSELAKCRVEIAEIKRSVAA